MISESLNLTEGIYSFIKSMRKKEDNGEILKTIFDSHFQYDPPNLLLRNLTDHLSGIYEVDVEMLIEYLAQKSTIKDEEDELLKVINFIKYKYGYMINHLIATERKPFLLNSVEVNIEDNSSSHMLKFARNDGKDLNALFEPASILSIISVLSKATEMAIQRGIYSLNKEDINNYLNSSEELKHTLFNLTNEQLDTK